MPQAASPSFKPGKTSPWPPSNQLQWQGNNARSDSQSQDVGSSIASDQATTLKATGNVTLAAAQNSSSESHCRAVGSTIGSVQGDVSIQAGQAYRQSGSSVLTPQGDIDAQAQSITIEEARQQTRVDSSSYSKQSGLNVGLGGAGCWIWRRTHCRLVKQPPAPATNATRH